MLFIDINSIRLSNLNFMILSFWLGHGKFYHSSCPVVFSRYMRETFIIHFCLYYQIYLSQLATLISSSSLISFLDRPILVIIFCKQNPTLVWRWNVLSKENIGKKVADILGGIVFKIIYFYMFRLVSVAVCAHFVVDRSNFEIKHIKLFNFFNHIKG